MTIFPVMIDARPPWLGRTGDVDSLLLTSVGPSTLLRREHEAVAAVSDQPLTVLTEFAADAAYTERLCALGVRIGRVFPKAEFAQALARLEPSDWLLLVNTQFFPAAELDLDELLRSLDDSHAAIHLVAMETGGRGTKEYVQFDAQGAVERIQRYYDGVTWLRTSAVACSLAPVGALRELLDRPFRDLSTLRESLVSAGVVSRDLGLSAGAYDLREERGLLRLNERVLHGLASDRHVAGFRRAAPGIWVGRDCRIHPTARLYGPLVIHSGVTIEAGATVIGPTTIGAGAQIGEGAIVAMSLVTAQARVSPRVVANCHVLAGEVNACPLGAADGGAPAVIEPREETPSQTDDDRLAARRRRHMALKRVADTALAAIGLVALSPLLLLTALLIKLTSRGPVMFRHAREGLGGKPFLCLKYRTMEHGAHGKQRELYQHNAVDGPQFKMAHDPRITFLGRWLRTTNIDELPQLFNVLMGQMSLIGPRPSPFRENQICVPWRQARLSVRPGITGLWQICRHERAAGDFHQWIYYDMLYVRHMSFLLDLKILVVTLLTFGGRWSVPLTWLISSHKLLARHNKPHALRRTPLTARPESAAVPERVPAGAV